MLNMSKTIRVKKNSGTKDIEECYQLFFVHTMIYIYFIHYIPFPKKYSKTVLWNNITILNNHFQYELFLKCNLFMWCKAEFSASLLQSSVSHDPSEIILTCWFASQEKLFFYYYWCVKQLCCFIFLWSLKDSYKVQKNCICNMQQTIFL